MDINANTYHTLPMVQDSQKAATYARLAFNAGSSNQEWRDQVLGGGLTVYRAYHFGHFQAYYGGDLSLGNYQVHNSYLLGNGVFNGGNDTTYHLVSSNRFYGFYGLGGGVNLVIPFRSGRGEWRAIGLETAYHREFGDYLSFRKQLPESSVDILETYTEAFRLGATTEIVTRSGRGTEFGYKFTLGTILNTNGFYRSDRYESRPYYVSNAFHITKQKVTGFMQFNIGLHSGSFQFGVNYNLSKKTE
jgi:hypothetical protein